MRSENEVLADITGHVPDGEHRIGCYGSAQAGRRDALVPAASSPPELLSPTLRASSKPYMFATRTCRALPFLAASSLRCRPSPSTLIHHLKSGVRTRSLPRQIASPWSPHRNISISSACRAQYSRFDDHPNQDPNHPPPLFSGLQRRDVIIYTLGIGSVVYYFLQCVIVLHSHSTFL